VAIADGRQIAFGHRDRVLAEIVAPRNESRQSSAASPAVQHQQSANMKVLSHASQ